MVAWISANLWQNELFADDVTGLIVTPKYIAQQTLPGVPAVVIACVKAVAFNYAMIVNAFVTNAVKTAEIHSWWYEEIAWIDPVHRN
jgi:hypothetical protein